MVTSFFVLLLLNTLQPKPRKRHTYKHTHTEFIPQLCFEFIEARPLAGIIRPALCHQAVQSRRALRGHRQSLAILYPANDVVVLHTLEGLYAVH